MSQDQGSQSPDDKYPAERTLSERQEPPPATSDSSLYRQLSSSEIRLIKILPGDWRDPISCELVYVPLNDRPKYVALSYAWGDATKCGPVTINGQSYPITISLFTGLRRLRYMVSAANENPETFITDKLESFHLWVDAICINQGDEIEKSRQIARMRDIYSFADRVYVWLGENEEREDKRAHWIMGMAHCVGLAFDAWETFLREFFDQRNGEYDIFARGIVHLSMRPWFSRIWVIQEVGLAKKPPIILAGGAWSYMDSLQKFFVIVREHPTRDFSFIPGDTFTNRLSLMAKIRKDYHVDKNNREAIDINASTLGARLNKILNSTYGRFEATLPHDYIYGLLGLLGARVIPHPLTPGYNKPYSQVYQEYAKFIFEKTGNLSTLLRLDSNISGVPSWVPDFRSHTWKTFQETPHPISFSDDGTKMNLMSLELGFGKHVYSPGSRSNSDADPIFSTRTQNFDSFLSRVSEIKQLSKDETIEGWLESEKDFQRHTLSIADMVNFYHLIVGNGEQVNENHQTGFIRTSIARSVGNFSIFLTENGILAKLYRFDHDAQSGDVLVAAKGMSSPLLLRPTDKNGEYEFLGSCGYNTFEYSEDLFSNQALKQFVIV